MIKNLRKYKIVREKVVYIKYSNFEDTDTALPSHLEITVALTCK